MTKPRILTTGLAVAGLAAGTLCAEAAGPGTVAMQSAEAFASHYLATSPAPKLDVEAKIREIIVQQLSVKPERVTLTTRLVDDLGADSLDTVELVMAFEEEFRIEIPDDKAEKMRTVGNVVTFIKEAIAGKSK